LKGTLKLSKRLVALGTACTALSACRQSSGLQNKDGLQRTDRTDANAPAPAHRTDEASNDDSEALNNDEQPEAVTSPAKVEAAAEPVCLKPPRFD
jgi:hypothetical protein